MNSASKGLSKFRSIYIAGHTGLVGSGLTRHFSGGEGVQLLTALRSGLDLSDPAAVLRFLERTRPEAVIIAAGRVGGIRANSRYPAEFIYENLMIEANLIHGAWRSGVRRLLNFGSSCMYPKNCRQPMSPEDLMTGRMEPTSEPYAVAKWAGLSLCASYNREYGTSYVTAIPCTVYGPGDNDSLEDGHVISALIGKFHRAVERKENRVALWGSGTPKREFIYVDDLAEACDLLLRGYDAPEPVNVGSSQVVSIRELAGIVAEVVGFQGTVEWDASVPDGAPEKSLDSAVIRSLGWRDRTPLKEGITRTVQWFLEHSLCASS